MNASGARQAVAQPRGLGARQLAAHEDGFVPGDQVAGDQDQLNPDSVHLKVAEGSFWRPVSLSLADVVFRPRAGGRRDYGQVEGKGPSPGYDPATLASEAEPASEVQMLNHFVNAVEVGCILGVSRARVGELASEPGFGLPNIDSDGYRVWYRGSVERWALSDSDREQRGERPELPLFGPVAPQAERILELARMEARQLNHRWVGFDHLLLGMLRRECPGFASDVLRSLGLSARQLRQSFVESMGDPFEPSEGALEYPHEPTTTLRRASTAAWSLRDEVVASEHVLIAAAEDWEADAWGPLVARGISADTVRHRVLAVTEGTVPISELPAPEPPPKRRSSHIEPDLAPTPGGRDPRQRKPWGAMPFADANGNVVMQGKTVLEYLFDRDGNPVLTKQGLPVHMARDSGGRPLRDENGEPILEALAVPLGCVVNAVTPTGW